jgi:hypothetical protein
MSYRLFRRRMRNDRLKKHFFYRAHIFRAGFMPHNLQNRCNNALLFIDGALGFLFFYQISKRGFHIFHHIRPR